MDTQDFRNSDGADAEQHIVYADNASDKVSFTEGLLDNVAISFVRIGVAPGATAAGICKYTIRANNTTDRQARTGQFHFSINNKAGTESAAIGTIINEAVDATTGSLNLVGFTTDASAPNAVDIKCQADTDLTSASMFIDYQIQITSGNPTIQSQ
jgi:hypothetical protein